MAEWFEDEHFWISTFPHLFPEWRFAVAGDEVERLSRLARFEGGPVLDLHCGPGRHSIALATRGHAVTAVDSTAWMLDEARRRADGLPIEFVLADARRFNRPRHFALAIHMFNSFGYFASAEQDLTALTNIFESLRPGGRLVLQTIGKEPLARAFQQTTSQVAADGSLLVLRHEIVADWSRARETWHLMREQHVEQFTFEYTVYSGTELTALLTQAGFSDVRLYGDLEGGSYGVDAQSLIAVAGRASDPAPCDDRPV